MTLIDATPESSRFRADIQGLRALAVIAVVAYHAETGFSGGFVGVDVFFVVSGYVITRMLDAERRTSGKVGLGAFYLRRIRRILPALATLVIAVVALAPLLGSSEGTVVTTRTGMAGSLFVSNLYLTTVTQSYFDPGIETNALLHLWSLSVEEQFYLVFPLLLIVAWRISRRRPTVVVGAAAALSLLVSLALTYGWLPLEDQLARRAAFYVPPARAWEFLAGALLALGAPRLGRRVASAAAVVGLGLVAYAVFVFDDSTIFPGVAALVPVVGTGMLVVAEGSPLAGILSSRPARWLGDLSYSWYLWHWPLIVFAHALVPGAGWAGPAAGVLSLGPAWLSYRFVENPIRHRRVPAPRTLALGAACVLVPVVVAVGLVPLRSWTAGRLDTAQPELRSHIDVVDGCSSRFEGCTYDVGDATGTAVLIGDSNAGHLSEAFLDATRHLRLQAEILTRSECPFADVVVRSGRIADVACRQAYEDHLAALIEARPGLVVVASSTDGYLNGEEFDLARSVGGPWASGPSSKAEVMGDALTSTLSELRDAGIGVVVVHPIPKFLAHQDPRVCAAARLILREESCGSVSSTADMLERRSGALGAEERAVAAVDAVSFDPAPILCPDPTCSTRRDGTWWWSDNAHISTVATRALAPGLEEAMRSSLGS